MHARCPDCRRLSGPEDNFCGDCGAALQESNLCPACFARSSPNDRFCTRCGGTLTGGDLLETSPVSGWSEERRLATVVFADIAGFTAISSHLEADAVWEFANTVFEPLTREVEARGGTVIKYIGDCLMAVFGVPRSAQDDARRAVQAALGMRDAVARLSEERLEEYGAPLAMRIGVHTGTVMVGPVGSGARGTPDIMGSAVNLASRLEGLAQPGQVIVSQATFRQIEGAFVCEPLGERQVKGLDEPVAVYLAAGEYSEIDREFGRGAGSLSTPQFLREDEARSVLFAFDEVVRSGRAGVVKIVADVGLGKSRLLREIRARLEDHAAEPVVLAVSVRVSATTLTSPLSLAGRILRSAFQVRSDEDVGSARHRAVSTVLKAWPKAERSSALEIAELLADLAALDPGSSTKGAAPNPNAAANDQLFGAFLAWIERLVSKRPVCLVLGDLHWADDSSLDLIERMMRATSSLPLFSVAAARPALDARRPGWWESGPDVLRVDLAPLQQERMESLLDHLLAAAPDVPASVRLDLVNRAEGNPEFMAELLRLLIDRGAIVPGVDDEPWSFNESRLGEIVLPDTILGVLQARLDELPEGEKELLKRAAVIGRSFWQGAVEFLWGAEGGVVVPPALSSLIARRIVQRLPDSSLGGEVELRFRNQSFRDVAYRLIPRAARERWHRDVARWLEARGTTWEGGHAELAGHLEAGGVPSEAVKHYVEAARHALAVHAHRDAVAFLGRALEHWGVDDPAGRAAARRRLAAAFVTLGQLDDAAGSLRLSAVDLEEAGTDPDDEVFSWLDFEWGQLLQAQGHNDAASERFDFALTRISDREAGVLHVWLYGQRAWMRLARGWIDGAREDCDAGLEVFSKIAGSDRSLGKAVSVLSNVRGGVAMRGGDLVEAEACFCRSLELAGEGDLPARCAALQNLGAIAFEQRRFDEAARHFEEGFSLGEKLDWHRYKAVCRSNLGQALQALGRPSEAQSLLEEALAMAERAGLNEVLADCHRALAEVRLTLGDPAAALEDARHAVEAARRGNQPHFEIPAHAVAMDCIFAAAGTGEAAKSSARDEALAHLDAAVAVLRSSQRPDRETQEALLRERFQKASTRLAAK